MNRNNGNEEFVETSQKLNELLEREIEKGVLITDLSDRLLKGCPKLSREKRFMLLHELYKMNPKPELLIRIVAIQMMSQM